MQLFRTFKDEAGGSIDFYFCQWLALWQKGQTCISPILMDLQYQWYTVDMIPSITLIWYSLFHGFSVKKENSPVKCWTNKYFCTAVGTKTKALWKTVTKIALLSLITVNFPLRGLIPSLQRRLVISVFNCKHFRSKCLECLFKIFIMILKIKPRPASVFLLNYSYIVYW